MLMAKITKHGGPSFGPNEHAIVRPEIGYVDQPIAEEISADAERVAEETQAAQAKVEKGEAKATPKKATGKK